MKVFTRHDYTKAHVQKYVKSYEQGTRRRKIKIISNLLGDVDGLSVLDVGIGSGFFSRLCVARQAKTVSVDFADCMITYHKEKSPELTLTQADAQHLPFCDEAFDIVLALDIIEHLPSAIDFLLEIRRVLKAKGQLVLLTPSTTNIMEEFLKMPLTAIRRICGSEAGKQQRTCTHVKEFSPTELKSLMGHVGLEVKFFDTFAEHMVYRIIDPALSFGFLAFLKTYKSRKAAYVSEKS